jgi:hypothetical protein
MAGGEILAKSRTPRRKNIGKHQKSAKQKMVENGGFLLLITPRRKI